MKKEAYYFSHDSNARQDEKIIKLRMKLGWEGYGLYWALIEMLRDAKDYKLETDYESIAFELRTECERIKSVIEDYGLFYVKKGMFYSTSLLNRMKLREDKSNKAREAAKKRWAKSADNQQDTSESNANGMRTHSESNAIKGKESKVKENKDIDTCLSFDDFWDMYDLKRGIENCKKKYSKISEEDRKLIKETLPLYVASTAKTKTENNGKMFRKNPHTYLNQKCWNDEIIGATTEPKPKKGDTMNIWDIMRKQAAEEKRQGLC
jgi:hypothetical protein